MIHEMSAVISNDTQVERRRIHPHKFAMWLAIGSITMMFAGLTSGYIVREAQGAWRYFKMPSIFWASTVVILTSSVTMALGLRAFRQRERLKYRRLMAATVFLGITFLVLQSLGFWQLFHTQQEMMLDGVKEVSKFRVRGGNPSEGFLFIITGLHMVHILGGIVALTIVYLLAYRKRVKVYNATGLEIVSTFWHFVDLLWIYLFIFFLANQQ